MPTPVPVAVLSTVRPSGLRYEKWTHTGSTETAASVVAGLALIGLSFSRWRAVAAANAAAAKAA